MERKEKWMHSQKNCFCVKAWNTSGDLRAQGQSCWVLASRGGRSKQFVPQDVVFMSQVRNTCFERGIGLRNIYSSRPSRLMKAFRSFSISSIYIPLVPEPTLGDSKQETMPLIHKLKKELNILWKYGHTLRMCPNRCVFMYNKGVRVCNCWNSGRDSEDILVSKSEKS